MANIDLQLTGAAEGDLEIGMFLGQQRAFGLVAGRCSAAQATCLREIRDKKLYKNRCPDWDRFCTEYLHMARSHVHHIIGLLDEFGPGYFELAQLTRVSPETYRAIRPSIQDGSLHLDGEAIGLIPANTARVAAAVAAMRKAGRPQPPKLTDRERLAQLEQICADVLERFGSLAGARPLRHELAEILVRLQTGLDRIQERI